MAEEGRSRKQHLLSAYPTSRGGKGTKQMHNKYHEGSLHSADWNFFTHGGFPAFCSLKNKNNTFILTFSTPYNPTQYHRPSSPPPLTIITVPTLLHYHLPSPSTCNQKNQANPLHRHSSSSSDHIYQIRNGEIGKNRNSGDDAAGESELWTVECDRVTFADLVTVWLARWWRVAEARTPFSLTGRRNKKKWWFGKLSSTGDIDIHGGGHIRFVSGILKEKQHLSRALEKKGERDAPPIRLLAVVDVVARAPSPAGTSAA